MLLLLMACGPAPKPQQKADPVRIEVESIAADAIGFDLWSPARELTLQVRYGPAGSEERAALTHKPPKEELIGYVLRFPALKSGVCYSFEFVVEEKGKLPADAVVKEVCTKLPAMWEAPP